MGFGWTTPFRRRLDYLGSRLEVWRSDGRGESFTTSTPGLTRSWQGDADTALILTQDPNGFTLTRTDGATERYNNNGQLISETDLSGKITSYSYDTSGRLSTVTGQFGHTLTFGYNASNHISTVTDPTGNPISYTYDSNNNLTQVNYPDNTAKIYYYEDTNNPHSLTGIVFVDSAGTTTRFGTYGYYYNSSSNAAEVYPFPRTWVKGV
jgi:YD repeat-containing protein